MTRPLLGPRNRATRLPTVLPNHPRAGNALTRATGKLALKLTGWTFEGVLPDESRLVMVVAPHTSAWDFPLGVAARAALGLRIRYLGKHTLFRPPFGWLMRWLGGIPVVRHSRQDVVRQVAERFRDSEQLFLALSPEGTRRRVERWKTGFWHIARSACVPILPIGLDFATRTIRIGTIVVGFKSLTESETAIEHKGAGKRARSVALLLQSFCERNLLLLHPVTPVVSNAV